MFNVGDKVKINTELTPYLHLSELHDTMGTIIAIHAEYGIAHAYRYTYHIRIDETTTITIIGDAALQLVTPQALTLVEIQQRKEQLARDLFALIETYEKTTNTHISTLTLRCASYQSDDKIVDRVIGVRLEVQL